MDGDKDREQQGMLDCLQWDAVDTAVIKDRNERFVRSNTRQTESLATIVRRGAGVQSSNLLHTVKTG